MCLQAASQQLDVAVQGAASATNALQTDLQAQVSRATQLETQLQQAHKGTVTWRVYVHVYVYVYVYEAASRGGRLC
jgi:phospholipase/lecithinase/hemolysin